MPQNVQLTKRRIIHLPVLELVLFLDKVTLELLKLGVVLLNGLGFLIDLLLQRLGNLVHVFIVLVDLVTCLVHVLLEVLQAEGALVQADVERSDITKQERQKVGQLSISARLVSGKVVIHSFWKSFIEYVCVICLSVLCIGWNAHANKERSKWLTKKVIQ